MAAERARRGLPAIDPVVARVREASECAAGCAFDVHEAQWPIEFADAILSINMLHIAPWSATQGLMRGAGAILPAGGRLCLYGPFRMRGRHTSVSNRAFHAQLQAADPSWGVRDLDEVAQEARAVGLELTRTFEMPANNLSVVFRKDRT